MKFEQRNIQLKKKAEEIVNFNPQEISQIGHDDIQRLLYDLQVYQIELEMQNDELEKAQLELAASRNKYHFLYHQVPVGIVIVNKQGFIEDSNQYFCEMLGVNQSKLVKAHLTSLIADKDKNQLINRFDAFFKTPVNKTINLQMLGNLMSPISVKLMGKQDNGADFDSPIDPKSARLIITVTDVSDIVTSE